MIWLYLGTRRFRFNTALLHLGRYVFKNVRPRNGYEQVALHRARKLAMHTLVAAVTVGTIFIIVGIMPIFQWAVYGKYFSASGIIIPFTDPESFNGKLFNSIYQAAVILTAFYAMITIECNGLMMNHTHETMADLVVHQMNELSKSLEKRKFDSKHESTLFDIYERLEDIARYIAEYRDLYGVKFFVQPMISSGCIALAAFVQYKVNCDLIFTAQNEFLFGILYFYEG